MPSLLDSEIKRIVARSFKGKLTRGVIRRSTGTTVNDKGDPGTPVLTTFAFEGIRESFSTYTRAAAGIPDTDVAILVLLGSVTPPTQVKERDLIYLNVPWDEWYQVRRILEIDPAGATARVQAYKVPAP